MKRRILLFLLSALGFTTACDFEEENRSTLCEYGTPNFDFRVHGKVTDRAGNPIPGIEVSNPRSWEGEKTLTADDGTYDYSGSDFPLETALSFRDIDGELNGGEFAEKTLEVEFTEADLTEKGSGSWYRGTYERSEVDVALDGVQPKE